MPRLPDRSLASRNLAVEQKKVSHPSPLPYPRPFRLDAGPLTHHFGRLVLPLVDEDLERLGDALIEGRIRCEALLDNLQRGLPESDEPIDHLVVSGGIEDDGETSRLQAV